MLLIVDSFNFNNSGHTVSQYCLLIVYMQQSVSADS